MVIEQRTESLKRLEICDSLLCYTVFKVASILKTTIKHCVWQYLYTCAGLKHSEVRMECLVEMHALHALFGLAIESRMLTNFH